ncbi:MAG: glycoside hydrolase family protein [bacterium]|nr:glycoside hydrolase family protein [bacterium]
MHDGKAALGNTAFGFTMFGITLDVWVGLATFIYMLMCIAIAWPKFQDRLVDWKTNFCAALKRWRDDDSGKARYSAAFIAMVVAGTIAAFDTTEGVVLDAYPDSAEIWTICRGYTPGVKKGDKKTEAECRVLDGSVTREEVLFVLDKVEPQLTVKQAIGLAHFVHNVGRTAFVNSTVRRRINAGDQLGGCDAMRDWHYITLRGVKRDCRTSGKLCPGLITRREFERNLCLDAESKKTESHQWF